MARQPSRMDDELLALAFSLHANPGAYALLVGAGASFTSGIPVAWDVLMDLCGKAAVAAGEDIGEESPDEWWERTRNEQPTYSSVLEELAKTATLRQGLLEGYFEVTEVEREAGSKQPTTAHRGIAQLVSLGAVKVIITLNFDRLIEQALRTAGIEPTVITHPSEIEGMRPLHQLDCVVIHLHGDYKNPDSMLNTENELGEYAPPTKRLLERILEDYGLLIAGWSAKHDKGLREAIQKWHTNIARYPLVWIDPFDLGAEASTLVQQKRGTVLQATADNALGRLADAVASLRSRNAAHPLTIPVAVAATKRELSGRAVAISAHDTLAKAFSELHQHPDFAYSDSQEAEAVGGYQAILERIEESTKLPAALTATLAYWGDERTDRWWRSELERFSYRTQGSGVTALLQARRIAGLWLFYASGVSAVLAGRWELLADIYRTTVPSRSSFNGSRQSLPKFYDPSAIYEQRHHASAFFETLRPVLMEATTASAEALDEAWQTFELLRYTAQIEDGQDFTNLSTAFQKASAKLQYAQTAYEGGQKDASTSDPSLHTARHEAWEDASRLLGQISRQTGYGRVHVLAADTHNPDRGWRVPLATKIAVEVHRLGDAHNFVTSGLWRESAKSLVALEAASSGLGMLGRDIAHQKIYPSGGVVSSSMWLDTEESLYERGPRTLPV